MENKNNMKMTKEITSTDNVDVKLFLILLYLYIFKEELTED